MFETAVVNEPSVFEPLKFYCILSNQTGRRRKNAKKVIIIRQEEKLLEVKLKNI